MIPVSIARHLDGYLQDRRSADVLVVGGGTAGFVAATAAARNGARTVLAEYLPFLGGTHGGGAMVMGTIGFRPTPEGAHRVDAAGQLMVGGIPLEYYDRMLAARATSGAPGDPSNAWPKDLEISKVVIEEMVSESGADIWFMTQLVDVIVDDGVAVGALVTRGGGLVRVDTGVIIDASGDGIAAVQAGAGYEVGRPSDNKGEAATLYFEMGGIDLGRLLDHLENHPEDISHHHRNRGVSSATLRQDWEADRPFVVRLGVNYASSSKAGLLPTPVGAEHSAQTDPSLGTFWMHWRDGHWVASSFSVNMDTTYGLDPRDRDAYDDALVATRRFVLDMVRYYQAHAPGFEQAYLLRFATLLGVREGPRILGRYLLTETDVRAASDFPDAVGLCGVRIDIHPEDPGGREFLLSDVGGDRGWYQVPYRALVAAGVDGLMMAGRNISADHIAHGSARHQVTCMMIGQAAGTAAAIASRQGVPPHAIDISLLQSTLRRQGAII
ncbi:MAG: FAD-dependent oxidoreductase [bacterium]|nr:FAD-dependent oxidoreductase [bacterium]